MTLRRLALLGVLSLSILGVLGAGSAAAATIWNLDVHHNQTNFVPGGEGELWFDVVNVGDTASSGPIQLTVNLPSGMTAQSARGNGATNSGTAWNCPNIGGTSSFTCVTPGPVLRHDLNRDLIVTAAVIPSASRDRFVGAKVEGGGAAAVATAVEKIHFSAEPAGFGFLTESFKADFFDADGLTTVRRSGSHPDLATFAFDFNSIDQPTSGDPKRKAESGSIRNLRVDLPPGFLGNPTAVGECTPSQLSFGDCPLSSQVGRADLTIYPIGKGHYRVVSAGVFNMVHPRGSITDLAFTFTGIPVHIKASLDPANNYAITTKVSDINESLPPYSQKLTIWGVPAAASHDSERCHLPGSEEIDTTGSCPTDAAVKPFLTVPFQCGVDNVMRLRDYDSWQETGIFGSEIDYVTPGHTIDCDAPRFEPEVEVEPTGKQANTPTGLDVHIKVPQSDTNPSALSTPPVRRTVVTLPQGMSFSPSFADGLQSCTLAEVKLGTNEAISCPDASRVGEVTLSTPLLPGALEGSMYLAAQGDNPFGSLFALYLVLHDTEERGVLVKIPGRIDVDPVSGQITTVFDETPQFPFDDLTLKFRSGTRAPLVNPPACGLHTIGVTVASWAQPNVPVDLSNTYRVSEGPNGTACPADSAHRPFSPELSAGTADPTAGAYSPFSFELRRSDTEQELSQVTAVLPPGLTAKIAGVTPCPEEAIASISKTEGTAAGESANPACPASSQIGTLSAGLGAGPGPNYFPGRVYLAGPYKGAPLSLAVVAPGLAGPFDLGNVVVRTALFVDHRTAQVTAVSDPFPTILQGVILRVRDVRLRVDRPETTLNPTNCEPLSVGAAITGVGGDTISTGDDSLFTTANPFRVGDCASLAFKPKLDLRLFGGTRRGAHPKLRARLTMPRGGANIAAASVALPHSEFLDQAHIKTVCTRVQFRAEQCPKGSVYGTAVAKTPLFAEPLSGLVYLRSSDNPLPDMVAVLKGPAAQPIQVDLVGRIDSVNGGIRNTFDIVPDAPVETFTLELQGGSKGLLVNSRDLCKSVNRATAKFTAQSGKVATLKPPLQNSCGGKAQKKAKRARHRHR